MPRAAASCNLSKKTVMTKSKKKASLWQAKDSWMRSPAAILGRTVAELRAAHDALPEHYEDVRRLVVNSLAEPGQRFPQLGKAAEVVGESLADGWAPDEAELIVRLSPAAGDLAYGMQFVAAAAHLAVALDLAYNAPNGAAVFFPGTAESLTLSQLMQALIARQTALVPSVQTIGLLKTLMRAADAIGESPLLAEILRRRYGHMLDYYDRATAGRLEAVSLADVPLETLVAAVRAMRAPASVTRH